MRNRETETENEMVAFILNAILGSIIVGLALTLTGCASSHGWRFEIGVSPVNDLDNNAGFSAQGAAKVEAEKARRQY